MGCKASNEYAQSQEYDQKQSICITGLDKAKFPHDLIFPLGCLSWGRVLGRCCFCPLEDSVISIVLDEEAEESPQSQLGSLTLSTCIRCRYVLPREVHVLAS